MFSSDFSHALKDIGQNYMSNDSSDVLVLRGEQFFQKFFNLRILWFLFILFMGSVFAHFFSVGVTNQTDKYLKILSKRHCFARNFL